jgi:hypothetical protein
MSINRLAREAINSYLLNLIRQSPSSPGEGLPAPLDPDSMPWPQLQGLLLWHLRHKYTTYDAQLSAGADRDTLRAEIHTAAMRAYPFLRADPRPLPPEPKRRYYDNLAARLDGLREHEHMLTELLSYPSTREGRPYLRDQIAETRGEIARLTEMLTYPELAEGGEQVVSTYQPTLTGQDYDWLGYELRPYATQYAGYQCPRCGAGVYYAKQAKAIGQGRRVWIYSCHCMVYFSPAAHGKIQPVSREEWAELAEQVAAKSASTKDQT